MMPLRGENDNSDDEALIRRLKVTTTAEVMSVSLRLPRQERAEAGMLQGEPQWFCIAIPPSLCAEKLG
jgi:hypothetical protein